MAVKDYTGEFINTLKFFQPNVKPIDFSSVLDDYNTAYDKSYNKSLKSAYSDALASGDESRIDKIAALIDPEGANQRRLAVKDLADQRQWQRERDDLSFERQKQMAAQNFANKLKLAQIKSSMGGEAGFGNSPIGLALSINRNPEGWSENAKNWSNEYLSSGYDKEMQKAMGKEQGKFYGTRSNEEDLGYYREKGQKYVTPNTEAEEDYLAKNDKKIANNNEITRVANTVVEDIDRATNLINSAGYDLAGWSGTTMSYIPETAAHDLKVLIDSIKGNSGVDSLLNIKRSGAGLGQIPQSQMDMLSNLIGNLDQTQSLPQLVKTLERYRNIYQDVLNNAKSDNEKIYGRIKQPSLKEFSSSANSQKQMDDDAWGQYNGI